MDKGPRREEKLSRSSTLDSRRQSGAAASARRDPIRPPLVLLESSTGVAVDPDGNRACEKSKWVLFNINLNLNLNLTSRWWLAGAVQQSQGKLLATRAPGSRLAGQWAVGSGQTGCRTHVSEQEEVRRKKA